MTERKPLVRLTPPEKKEFLQYYKKHGLKATAAKYGYRSENSAYDAVKRFRKQIKFDTRNNKIFTDEQRLEILKYYEENGGPKTAAKFGISSQRIYDYIGRFRNKLSISAPPIVNNVSSISDKETIVKEYEEHGKEYVMKKYNYKTLATLRVSICAFRKEIANRANVISLLIDLQSKGIIYAAKNYTVIKKEK